MTELPSAGRIVKALLIASALAAWPTYIAIPTALSAGPAVLLVVAIGFGIALGHAVALGLPLYLLLARHGAPRPGIAILAGGLIGALPIAILALVSMGPNSIGPLTMLVMLFGFCGLLGGAAFDFIVTRASDPA